MIITRFALIAFFGGATVMNEIGLGALVAYLYIITEPLLPLSLIIYDSRFMECYGFFSAIGLVFILYYRIFCAAYIVYNVVYSRGNGYEQEELKQYDILIKYLMPILLGSNVLRSL